ncbi:MAG: DUF4199 domain-containing protein [Bacteroidales bacterium]
MNLTINKMENQTNPVWKHTFQSGIFLGIALIILSLLFYVLDMHTQRWTGFISYGALLIGIIYASVTYRDKFKNGLITYGQSFSTGFYTGLFAAVIISLFTGIFVAAMGEQYIESLLQQSEETILKSNPDITDDQLDMALNISKRMMHPVWLSIISFAGFLIFTVIFSLIASVFIKKEDRSLDIPE